MSIVQSISELNGLNLNVKTEAVSESVLWEKMFWKISQNSQENTCVRVSFLISGRPKVCKIFKNTFFTEHVWTTASVKKIKKRMHKLEAFQCHKYQLSKS